MDDLTPPPVDKARAAAAQAIASKLAANNAYVQVSLVLLNASRQLYQRVVDGMQNLLLEHKVPDADMVLETFQVSAMRHADNNAMSMVKLQGILVNQAIPFVDVLVQREAEYMKEKNGNADQAAAVADAGGAGGANASAEAAPAADKPG